MAPKAVIRVWHADDHRIHTYHWDPASERYVLQPGPGRARQYGEPVLRAQAEQSRRELTRLLEQMR